MHPPAIVDRLRGGRLPLIMLSKGKHRYVLLRKVSIDEQVRVCVIDDAQ